MYFNEPYIIFNNARIFILRLVAESNVILNIAAIEYINNHQKPLTPYNCIILK